MLKRLYIILVLLAANTLGIYYILSEKQDRFVLQETNEFCTFMKQDREKRKVIVKFTKNKSYIEAVVRASYKYEVDEKLICSVISTESAWDEKAESWIGAVGLMQITYPTVLSCAKKGLLFNLPENFFNPRENVDAGTCILSHELSKFKLPSALAAYNGGHRYGVLYSQNKRVPRETKNYVPRVLEYYEM